MRSYRGETSKQGTEIQCCDLTEVKRPRKQNFFEHQWTDLRGNLVKLVAHATAPVSSNLGTRQYDLFINGKSFFTLPKTYEIGLTGVADSRIPGVISRDPPENDRYKRPVPTYSDSGRHLMPHSQEEVCCFICVCSTRIFLLMQLLNFELFLVGDE